jgi:hypothetical protein
LTAVVVPDSSYTGSLKPTGTVTFEEGASVLGPTQQLDPVSGTATLAITIAAAGAHFYTAAYSGDSNFNPNKGNLLHNVTSSVGTTPTTTTLIASPNPAFLTQQVNLVATVTAAGGTPGGNVDFKEGANTLGTAPLNSGTATFGIATLAAGPHPIVAAYKGNNIFSSSQSAPVTLTINPAPPPPQKVIYVQTAASFLGTGGASISLAFSATKGNLVIVTVFWQYSAAPTTMTISDGTNVYLSAVQSAWGTNRIAQVFYAFNNAVTGVLNIKATPSAAATELRLVVSEYANASAAPPNPLDGTGKQTGAGTTIGPATFTTALTDDLIYAVAAGTGAGGTMTPTAGFASRTPAGLTNLLVEDQQAAGTSQSAGGTDSVAAGTSIILALAIRHA